MSTPENNWEEHWRDSLAGHESSPPSAMDWGRMEELLQPKVAPLSPIKAPIPGPEGGQLKLPGLPWPIWIIAIASVLALGYWLGSHTAVGVSQEMEAIQKETSLAEALTPSADTIFDTLYSVNAIGELTDEIASIEWAVVNKNSTSSPQKSPEINTSNPNYAAPTLSAPVKLNSAGLKADSHNLAPSTAPAPAAAPELFDGLRRPNTSSSPPGLSYDLSSKPAVRPNRGGYVRPLKTLSPPTDRELLEQRIDALSLSEKLVILPIRYKNGHFPAYRPRN